MKLKGILAISGYKGLFKHISEGKNATVVDIKGHKIALLICEDIWLPEPAQAAVKKGAESLLVLNASPFHRHKNQQRLLELKQRVSETGCHIFYLNMIGGQDELVFDGASLVLASNQEIISRAASFQVDEISLLNK